MKTAQADRASIEQDRMRCMEVWGGNTPVDRSFRAVGLEGWVYHQPFDVAKSGGDVYYASSCASGRITRLLLADVSGHGQQASRAAVALRDLMRKNINYISQTRLVREINKDVAACLDDDSFATLVVCTFFSPTRSLQICNAGHPFPLVYRSAGGNWTSADLLTRSRQQGSADFPLGVTDGGSYSRFDTSLAPGDMVLCVSDAFTESCNSDGKILGPGGLLEIVQELPVAEPSEIIGLLIEVLRAKQYGNLTQDDATALLIRADGLHTSVAANILAPLRLLRTVEDSTTLVERPETRPRDGELVE